MTDWVAVAHLPSCKVRRTLHRWSIEVPRAIMPNRQRTMCSFYTPPGARVPTVPAPMPTQVTTPAPTAPRPSRADELGRTITDDTEQHLAVSAASQSAATETLWHKTVAKVLLTCRRHGEWRLSRTHCVESSPATTPTEGAPTRRRTSAPRRRTTGPVVSSSISPTSLRSGKTPLSSTPPRVNERHW